MFALMFFITSGTMFGKRGVYGQITNFTSKPQWVHVTKESDCGDPSTVLGSVGTPGTDPYSTTIIKMDRGTPSYVDGWKLLLKPLNTLCVYSRMHSSDDESIEFNLESGARSYVINPGSIAPAHGKLYPSSNKTANYDLVYVDAIPALRALPGSTSDLVPYDTERMYVGIVPAVNLTVTNDCGITFHFSHGDGTGGLYWTDWVKEKSAATEFNCVPLRVDGYNYDSGVYEMQNPLTGNIVKNGSLFLIVSSFSGKQVYASLNFNQIGKGFDMKDGTVDPPYWGPDAKQYSLRAKSSMTYSVEKQADGTYTKNLNIHFRDPWTKL